MDPDMATFNASVAFMVNTVFSKAVGGMIDCSLFLHSNSICDDARAGAWAERPTLPRGSDKAFATASATPGALGQLVAALSRYIM
jgi:hypothetical protein